MAALGSRVTILKEGNKKLPCITDFFEIQHVTGSGSFGTVFQAQLRCDYDIGPRGSTPSPSTFALKKISLSSEKTIIKEIDALHTLHGNPNVVQLLYCIICEDEITHAPSVYLAFPFFQNIPYNKYVQNITAIEFKAYILQLFLALEFIHLKGILHRDLKPSNVLFDRCQLRLNVVDFGLAERSHHQQSFGASILCDDKAIDPRLVPRVGTFGYRAPEVLFGSHIQTAAMDVWSAGQICLNLLTGRCDWFYYKHDLPSRQAMDAFTIAQLCSMIGSAAMKEAALALKIELRCIFPANTPLFPLQGQPISSLLVLRNDASRFDTFYWKIVNLCWQPNPIKRCTASNIVTALNAHAQGGEALVHSTILKPYYFKEANMEERYFKEANMEERKRSDLDHEFQSKNVPHGHIQVISAKRGESRSSTVHEPVVEFQFTAPSGSNPWRFFTFSEQKTSGGNFVSPFQTRTQADARIVEKVVSKPVYTTGIVAQGNSTIKHSTKNRVVQ